MTSDRLFVDVYGDQRIARRKQWFSEAVNRLEWIRQQFPSGTLLEVGSATGEFVATAAKAGYDAYGCDTSSWAVERAADLGDGQVSLGTLAEWRNAHPGVRVGAMAMFHVLEHLRDPGVLVDQARSMLDENGLLFVEVPNFASAEGRRNPLKWEAAMLDDHFHHFTPSSLTRLLTGHGFEVTGVDQLDWRAYDSRLIWWLRRMRWLRAGIVRPSQDLLRVSARAAGGD